MGGGGAVGAQGEHLEQKHRVTGDNEETGLCRKDGFMCVCVCVLVYVCVCVCVCVHIGVL